MAEIFNLSFVTFLISLLELLHTFKDGGHNSSIRKSKVIIPTKIQCNNKEINNSINKPSTNLVDSIMPKIYATYIPLIKMTADNDEPTLKDVMSNLTSVKGLIEGIEKSFSKLELQEVKVTSLEESRSFILNKYEDKQSYLNKFNTYSK